MLRFDESGLVGELGALPEDARVAFAVAAATRQLGNYEHFGRGMRSQERPREIAVDLWNAVQRHSSPDRAVWLARLEEVMALLPEDDISWSAGHAWVEDALSSLAYAIRCLLTPEPQEAAWAGRRAYEAADQAAIRLLNAHPGSANAETRILSHEVVQRELSRQQHDLSLLRSGLIEEVQRNSFEYKLLRSEEVGALTSVESS